MWSAPCSWRGSIDIPTSGVYRFEAAMQQLGANSVLRVFGDAKHDVTSEMRLAACAFLGSAMTPRAPHGTPLAAEPLAY